MICVLILSFQEAGDPGKFVTWYFRLRPDVPGHGKPLRCYNNGLGIVQGVSEKRYLMLIVKCLVNPTLHGPTYT